MNRIGLRLSVFFVSIFLSYNSYAMEDLGGGTLVSMPAIAAPFLPELIRRGASCSHEVNRILKFLPKDIRSSEYYFTLNIDSDGSLIDFDLQDPAIENIRIQLLRSILFKEALPFVVFDRPVLKEVCEWSGISETYEFLFFVFNNQENILQEYVNFFQRDKLAKWIEKDWNSDEEFLQAYLKSFDSKYLLPLFNFFKNVGDEDALKIDYPDEAIQS